MICTLPSDKHLEDEHVRSALMTNGYPPTFISGVSRQCMKTRSDEPPSATVVLPYIRNTSESVRRILATVNIRTCFKPHRTLRHLLVYAKGRVQMDQKIGVIYKIPCSTCNQVYIGQTGRTLQHRVKEHQRSLTSWDGFYVTSAVAEHAIKTGHTINWSGAQVIDQSTNFHHRNLLESWHIQSNGNALNREVGNLPKVYSSLM